jgi:hypothetical protein
VPTKRVIWQNSCGKLWQVKMILGNIQKATNQAVMATQQGTKGQSQEQASESDSADVLGIDAGDADVGAGAQQTIGLDQIAIGMNDIDQAAQLSASDAQYRNN